MLTLSHQTLAALKLFTAEAGETQTYSKTDVQLDA